MTTVDRRECNPAGHPLGELASHRTTVPTTAPTPEMVDTLRLLTGLAKSLPDFCRRAVLGELEPEEWVTITEILHGAAAATTRHVVIDVAT